MSEQFTKLTIEKLVELHSIKPLPAWLLVYFYFDIKIPPGRVLSKTHKAIYQELGLSERTYYHALSEVREKELIFWRNDGKNRFAKESKLLHKNEPSCTENSTLPTPTVPCKSQQGSLPTPTGYSLPTPTGYSANSNSQTPPKPALGGSPAAPSDSLQIINIKSINQMDDDFDFWLKGELEKRGVNDHDAYLKTLDKATGQPLIEKFRAEYSQRNKTAPGSLTAHQAWEKALKLSSRYSGGGLAKYLNPNEEPKLAKAIQEAGGLATIGQTPTYQLSQLKSAFTEAFNNYQAPVLA